MAKILIIDDEVSVLNFFRRVVERLGHEAVEFENGEAALSHLRDDGAVDMVISDLNLTGELQGIELIREIHALRPSCPIVVASGYPSEDRLSSCRELGVRDFLTKPFELGFIHSLIRRCLEGDADVPESVSRP